MELKFNSQVSTTIKQSKKLLELGLKQETADMYHTTYYDANDNNSVGDTCVRLRGLPLLSQDIPAWSLHRLMNLMPKPVGDDKSNFIGIIDSTNIIAYHQNASSMECFENSDSLYDNAIDCIEWLIQQGYFNIEYLNK